MRFQVFTFFPCQLKHEVFRKFLDIPPNLGRWVETAVGSTLFNGTLGKGISICYWQGKNREVDFVLSRGKDIVAIEVTSGRKKENLPGMEAFSNEFKVKRTLLVGGQGMPLENFFLTPPEQWIG